MKVSIFFSALYLALALCSCYRMPEEDEFSVVPTINNPALTNEKTDRFVPGLGY